jgi:hypothetical protein
MERNTLNLTTQQLVALICCALGATYRGRERRTVCDALRRKGLLHRNAWLLTAEGLAEADRRGVGIADLRPRRIVCDNLRAFDCRVCGGAGWTDGSAELRRDGRDGDTTCIACNGTGHEADPAMPITNGCENCETHGCRCDDCRAEDLQRDLDRAFAARRKVVS